MDSLEKKFQLGAIGKSYYRNAAVKATINILNSTPSKCTAIIGSGTYGSVVAVEGPSPETNIAAKIVLKSEISQNELRMWPLIKHDNILQLIARAYLPKAHTHVFYTKEHPISLDKYLHIPNFLSDPTAFDRAISWLRGVLNGLSYLHTLKLCHLDIKCDNVLISESDTAVICDFGFINTVSYGPVKSYGSPFIYRAPEARKTISGYTPVHGLPFDMWTVGTLSIEIFTRHSILGLASDLKGPVTTWAQQMYPVIFDILQKCTFEKLMNKAFPASISSLNRESRNAAVNDVIHFVTACLDLNHVNRPSADEALSHSLFGKRSGNFQRCTGIWSHRVPIEELEKKLNYFVEITMNESAVKIQSEHLRPEAQRSVYLDDFRLGDRIDAEFEKPVTAAETGVLALTRRYKFVMWTKQKRSVLAKFFTSYFSFARRRM